MDTTFDELGFDSLDGLNLVFELEEEFDMTIPDDKVQDMRGVRQAVEGIEMLLAAKEQGIDVNAVAAEEFAAKQAEFRKQKDGPSGKTEKTADAPIAVAETEKTEEKPD
jgi:hypothetical protein